MGSPISSPTPSPAFTSDLLEFFKLLVSKSAKGQLLRIELSVLTTFAMLFLLLFLGRRRRHVRFGWFATNLTKTIYVLIPISITYSMGLMHNASIFHVLYPFWACTLVYAYGGVTTMTACDFSDNEQTLRYFWHTLPLFFWTCWLVALLSKPTNDGINMPYSRGILLPLLFLYLISAARNMYETLVAFYIASKSMGLPYEAQQTVSYMGEDGNFLKEGTDAGPFPRYLVWGNPIIPNNGGIITTGKICQSTDRILPKDCVHVQRLQDLCLSYAFFRLILRRFVDFPISESSHPEIMKQNRDFIREGLRTMNDPERVFHIVEVELRFLFNFFYTKSHTCSYGIVTVCFRLFLVIALGFFTFHWLPHAEVFSIHIHGHSLEVGVTRIVIFIFFLLEVWKFFNVWFSSRSIVRLLCTTCKMVETPNCVGSVWIWFICLVWMVKYWISKITPFSLFFKPWQRQLGQYSLIDSYTQVPSLAHFSWLGKIVRIPRAGQAGQSSIKLSKQVKKAVVTSLQKILDDAADADQPARLSRGSTTIIERYKLPSQISSYFQLETDIHVILVWHIATSFCTHSHHPKNNAQANFLIATHLSKYCAYLVTFSPELLPVHPFTTKHLFDVAVEQAKVYFSKGNAHVRININDDEAVEKGKEEVVDANGKDKGVVEKGKDLAVLIERAFTPEERWKFLAEFWVEFLLYLAPSDNVATHGEYLARGGEFITHVWALLTHAGVVFRSINCPPMRT